MTRTLSQAVFAPLPQALIAPVGSRAIPGQQSIRTMADLIVYGSIATRVFPARRLLMRWRSGWQHHRYRFGERCGGTQGSVDADRRFGDASSSPGLIEPHMHLWSTVLADSWLNCSALENRPLTTSSPG